MSFDFNFNNVPSPACLCGYEALEAKAEVFMQEAIEMMDTLADAMTEMDEPPIAAEVRRAACVRLCEETFDRVRREWRALADRRKR